MDEGKMGEQLAKPQETKEINVKDSWFRAYYMGNATIPQRYVAISFGVCMDTILYNDQTNWWDFFDSQFSSEQIEELGEKLNRLHEKMGIPERYSKDGTTRIGPANLQNLWTTTKQVVGMILHTYITGREASNPINVTEIHTIDRFFKDPSNKEKIEKFKKILRVIDSDFRDPNTKALLDEYRREFLKKENQKPKLNVWRDKGYADKYDSNLQKKLAENFGGKPPENLLAIG